MAKGRQKKPKKGVRYIAQKLRKYYPLRYKNFNEALVKARIISEELKQRSDPKTRRVNLRNIFSVERIPRKPQDVEPLIPSGFYKAKYFFDVNNEFDLIKLQLPINVFVESKISKKTLPQLQGDIDNASKIQDDFQADPYELFFKDFVDYGNAMLDLSNGETSDYVSVFYTYTKPIRKNGKWVMFIIPSDKEAIQCDFGFDPNDFQLPNQFIECPTNYEDMPYNFLRRKAKQNGIKFKKSPTKKELIDALKKSDQPQSQPKEKPTKPQKTEDADLEKQKTKRIEAETKKIEAENKKRELDLREQELDMEKIQYGLMSADEFKKKWSKK
jgi:hypothetical protein